MKVTHIISIILALAIVALVGFIALPNEQSNTPSRTPTTSQNQGVTTPSAVQETLSDSKVAIYLIALDDGGKMGEQVGCGDSVVQVSYPVPPTTTPLATAITQLLSIKTQHYGQSELYNALYQSRLSLQKASITSGIASVYLTGTLSLGGTCDGPRVEAQLTKTAMQFPEVKSVEIFINGISLADALSQK